MALAEGEGLSWSLGQAVIMESGAGSKGHGLCPEICRACVVGMELK